MEVKFKKCESTSFLNFSIQTRYRSYFFLDNLESYFFDSNFNLYIIS